MKIISWNVNGLRSVHRKGFLQTLKKLNPDVLCLQEIKINANKLSSSKISLPHYFPYFNFAKKAGYAGTAIYTQSLAKNCETKINNKRFDSEGRMVKLKFENFTLINLYMPHGGRNKENLDYKLNSFKKIINLIFKNHKKTIVLGDFNIAHNDLDLARPKNNQNNIMFTPIERKQIDQIMKNGFLDSFREFDKENGNYTWWPYAFNARKRNLGWRLDYCFVSRDLKSKLKSATIYPKALGSDHCPIGIEINLK
jgi:exodeoxyribonuclease-3